MFPFRYRSMIALCTANPDGISSHTSGSNGTGLAVWIIPAFWTYIPVYSFRAIKRLLGAIELSKYVSGGTGGKRDDEGEDVGELVGLLGI